MKVNFDHADTEAERIRTFWFRPEKPFSYIAGQYIQLTLPHDKPDERGERRWFTLSSPPGHDMVSVTTKFAGEDSSSFKNALFSLQPGKELTMSDPMGDFVLPKDQSLPLIFVAGGIGLTPFHSMFEWMADHNEHRNIRFIYSVRQEGDIVFQKTFERAGIHATIIVGEPSASWGGERGRLTAELVIGLTQPSDKALIYLSGPEPMIEQLSKDLEAHDIRNEQLVTDFFPGYTGI